MWALGLEPISCQGTVINRNALLIIIITLTCAFLLEEEGGGRPIFFLSRAQEISWRRRGKFVCNSLYSWWLHHVEAQASETATHRLRRACFVGKWWVYARDAGVLEPPEKKKFNVQPRRAVLATGDILPKFRGGLPFDNVPLALWPVAVRLSWAGVKFKSHFWEVTFFPLSTGHNTGVPRGSFYFYFFEKTHQYAFIFLLKFKQLGDQVGLILLGNVLSSYFKPDDFNRCLQPRPGTSVVRTQPSKVHSLKRVTCWSFDTHCLGNCLAWNYSLGLLGRLYSLLVDLFF